MEAWRKANPEKAKEARRRWHQLQRAKSAHYRSRYLVRQHKDTLWTLQEGICPVCSSAMQKSKAEVGHIISVRDAERAGMTVEETHSIHNLALVRRHCNRAAWAHSMFEDRNGSKLLR